MNKKLMPVQVALSYSLMWQLEEYNSVSIIIFFCFFVFLALNGPPTKIIVSIYLFTKYIDHLILNDHHRFTSN